MAQSKKSNNRRDDRNDRQQAGKRNNPLRGKQGRKDSNAKRVNCDNERESKFVKQFEKDGMRASVSRNPNDISWYSRNPELLRAAATYPFGEVLGKSLAGAKSYVPGVMKIHFTFAYGGPTSGILNYGTKVEDYLPQAINQASKSTYSFLVHANSRNYVYEDQDLQIVISAGAQIFAALAFVARAYAVAKVYSEKSVYKPEAYLVAMGIDPTDFRNNLGQIWFDLNNLIAQTTQIWIPSEQPLLQRWIWMCSNIFTDAQSALGQSYIFVPTMFQQYNETGSNTGGFLEPATYPDADGTYHVFRTDDTQLHTWSEINALIQHMIDRLVNSEDRGIMFGDILNAYGADKIFAMAPVASDVRVEPVFNPEVLTQIENLTVTSAECLGLAQNTSGLYPVMNYPDGHSACSKIASNSTILNFHQVQQPTPEQIVIATRLMAAGSATTRQSYKIQTTIANENSASYVAETISSSASARVAPLAYGSELVSTISFVEKDSSKVSGWSIIEYPYDDKNTEVPVAMK